MGTHGATAQGGSQGLDYRVDLSVQGVDHRAAGVACVPARLCVCVFDRGVTSQPTFHPLCVV